MIQLKKAVIFLVIRRWYYPFLICGEGLYVTSATVHPLKGVCIRVALDTTFSG